MTTNAKVISFHYTLKDSEGEELDSSAGSDPMTFLEGSSMIIPGLETEILKLSVGDKRVIKVAAKDAYGEFHEDLVITVPRDRLPRDRALEVGDEFQARTGEGESHAFRVKTLGLENVELDGNHPLAGVDLTFDVEITEIRTATDDEMSHGHAHGPGGAHHH